MLFALTILAGWLSGFAAGLLIPENAWLTWPLISALSGVALAYLWKRYGFWWGRIVALLAGVMLLADGLYLGFRVQNVPIEVVYSRALDVCLQAQLLLIGVGGLRSGWLGFLDRISRHLFRRPLVAHARSSAEEAAG